MKESQDAGKYQVDNDKTVQGQVIGDHNITHQHFYVAQDTATSPSKPQRVWNIPYLRNNYFTGRNEILEQLHTRFQNNHATALSQRTAISGLGGLGKTQTAIEYAYRYHQDYQAVLWARAESHEALTSSFVEIATLLELPQKDEQDQTIIVQAVKRWLQTNNEWLLILDNADEPAVVREFLPTKFDGHILLTTRAQALGGLAKRIEVDTFTPELGALLLLRRATIIGADDALDDVVQSDREVAVQISEELGGLPLALDQAGAYLEETRCGLTKYLERYQAQRAKLLQRRGRSSHDHPDSVATTWSLSFERVAQNAVAADLLRLCAFLAPDAIPEEIVTVGAEHLGEHLQAVSEDEGLLDEAIAVLRAYSLIRRDTTEKTLSIHRLVQAVLRDAMSEDETKVWAERAVLAVNKACPDVEFAMWPQWERCLPHAFVCVGLIDQKQFTFLETISLLHKTGAYLIGRAQYQETEPLLQHALTTCEYLRGPEHPDVALCLNSLAVLYKNQSKYDQAELLYQQALKINEQQWGPEHPNTAGVLNNLALLYDAQGKYEQAKPLLKRALAIREQKLGPEHLDTAQCLSNLANLYRNQGKYPQAEPLYIHALAIREQQLAPKNPSVATTLSNLALLYYIQEKYEQAKPLYQRALAIREQSLGHLHPDTAISLKNLALLHQAQGKYAQAEPLYQRAIRIVQQSLGSHHPDTQHIRQNYATLLRAMGRDEQAKHIEEGDHLKNSR